MADEWSARVRELLDEVVAERARAVALAPDLDAENPPGSSRAWTLGLIRLATTAPRDLPRRRQHALYCATVSLAWLEAIDAELATVRGESPAG